MFAGVFFFTDWPYTCQLTAASAPQSLERLISEERINRRRKVRIGRQMRALLHHDDIADALLTEAECYLAEGEGLCEFSEDPRESGAIGRF